MAERLANRIILLAAMVGFVAGYILQLFKFTLFIIGLGCVIATLVCVPNWSFYNRQKASYKWLPEDHPAFAESPSDKKNPSSGPRKRKPSSAKR